MQHEVTVVVGVFNDGAGLTTSLDSILSQRGVDLDVVVVNDGSTDATAEILKNYGEGDSRLRILNQQNYGLTRALVAGCGAATGEYIARHDAGDWSDPERLAKQTAVLSADSSVSMVSSWVRYVGPDGEPAGGTRHDPQKSDAALEIACADQKRVRGPYHGAAMFRRADYIDAGGYREQFYFAQDVDLWLRLHERGSHRIVPEELYSARISPESITGRYRREQDECLELAVAAARARRAGESEQRFLDRAAMVRPIRNRSRLEARLLRARSFYFMGCVLMDESPASARRYFARSIREYPFQIKSWLRLAQHTLTRK